MMHPGLRCKVLRSKEPSALRKTCQQQKERRPPREESARVGGGGWS